MQTDISLSQFLAIQEKGVSAWEFQPELEIANCFVEGRTEIEFFDSECSVQTNLPLPKQNEVYYWEAKIYDKPESTMIGIGLTTKPYPLFRMPGMTSLSFLPRVTSAVLWSPTNQPLSSRLPQNVCCLPIDRPPPTQPAIHTDTVWSSTPPRRCYRYWLPTALGDNLLYSQRQEAGGCRPQLPCPKSVSNSWGQWSLHRSCQFWPNGLRIH